MFEKDIKNVEKEALIYIDYELSGFTNGCEYAKVLHEQGYLNIILTTGHQRDFFSNYPFLKKVIDKEVPW